MPTTAPSRTLRKFRGREINTTGDGFVASFDGPARAIRCSEAIVEATSQLGIELRVGLHTGECEVRGEDLGGLAVHIAARVGALAAPREVLVSRTVKDLVVGSRIEFVDRGSTSSRVCRDPGACSPWSTNPTRNVPVPVDVWQEVSIVEPTQIRGSRVCHGLDASFAASARMAVPMVATRRTQASGIDRSWDTRAVDCLSSFTRQR